MRRIRSERVIESKHVDGGMTKTTPEKSKARENNESERGGGAICNRRWNSRSHYPFSGRRVGYEG